MAPEVSLALRRGWTTRACAAAASRVAFAAMLTGRFPDPVAVRLPRGGAATFPLALAPLSSTSARAGVVKDAGHDCGIDVARAACLGHIAAAIGASSERAVQRLYELPD